MKQKIGVWVVVLSLLMMNVGPFIVVNAATGLGTPENPYMVTTCEELQGVTKDLTASYELKNDIDCTDTKNWNDGLGFNPIGGDGTNGFTGQLNGNGFHIKNVYINRPDNWYVGLFGYVSGVNTSIQNISLDNVTVKGTDDYAITSGAISTVYGTNNIKNIFVSGNVEGAYYVSSVVGYASSSTVSNVHATAGVKGLYFVGGVTGYALNSTIEKSSFDGNVIGAMGIGGLIGYMKTSTLSQSFTKGQVKNDEALTGFSIGRMGGAVGYMDTSSVTNSFSQSDVQCTTNCSQGYVGGFVGQLQSGTITNSYSTGYINTNQPNIQKGGFVGVYTNGTVTNSYWDVNTSGITTSAGNKGTSKTTAQLKQQSAFSGWDFTSVWDSTSLSKNRYPYLKAAPPLKTWKVTNAHELHTADSVTLSWSNPTSTEFDSVNIYRDGVKIGQITSNSFTDTNLQSDVTYTYTLSIVDERGRESEGYILPATTTDIIPTGRVQNLQATDEADGLHLSWKNPTDGDFDYVEIRRNDVVIALESGEFFIDTTVQEKENYTYTLTAYDDNGNPSESVSITIQVQDKTAPGNVTEFQANQIKDTVMLTWNLPLDDDIQTVTIYRNDKIIYSGTNTVYTDSGLHAYDELHYRIVVADTSNLASSSQNLDLVVQPWYTLSSVSNMKVAESLKGVLVTWKNPDDRRLDYVQIYRNGFLLGTTKEGSYLDTKTFPYTSYRYDVVAVSKDNFITPAISKQLMTTDMAPQSPTALMLKHQNGVVTLSWTKSLSPNVYAYEVYRNGVPIGHTTLSTFKDANAPNGISLTYSVYASSPTKLHSSPLQKNLFIAIPVTSPLPEPETPSLPGLEIPKTAIEPVKEETSNPESTELPKNIDETMNEAMPSPTPPLNESKTTLTEKVKKEFKQVKQSIKVTKKKKGYHLTWKPQASVVKVLIYRDGKLIGETTKTSYLDNIVSENHKPTYRLVFVMGNGEKLSASIKAKVTQTVTEVKEKATLSNSRISKEQVFKLLIPTSLFMLFMVGGAVFVAQRQTPRAG
ncbi:hypothetical protein CN918_31030 [Priestia megaterium]|nr:hypothetical protein CN918_31030 [Priestia megaterium]